jgi:uncharacterized membrane protein YdjX (TVP38/TMEM64 family)
MSPSRTAALKPLAWLPWHSSSKRRTETCAPEQGGSNAALPVSKKEYLWLVGIGAMLISAVLLVRTHSDSIMRFIEQHPVQGVCLFLILNILDAVIAPGATLPLIPVAAQVWGHFGAGLVTTAGWTAGSLIAFSIARRWGVPLVKKFASMDRLRQMKHYVPKDVFWSVVFLRLVMPMDLLSYVLGLFTHISWGKYVAATALGVTPPAFLLAYLGQLPHAYDIITFGIGGVVVVAYIMAARRRACRPIATAR